MKDFFDGFFTVLATSVAALSLADWLIGARGRKSVRDKLGHWWLFLEYSTWKGLAAEDARHVGKWLTKAFGDKFVSFKFIRRSFLVSFAIQNLAVLIYLISYIDHGTTLTGILKQAFTDRLFIQSYWVFAVLTGVLGWLTIGATIFFLRKMANSHSGIGIALFALLDAVVAVGLFYFMQVSAFALFDVLEPRQSRGQFGWMAIFAIIPVSVPAGITATWPSILHLTVCGVFMLSKMFRPVFKPALGFLLLRFAESDKGALTALAVGIAAAAKLSQEWYKYLSKAAPT